MKRIIIKAKAEEKDLCFVCQKIIAKNRAYAQMLKRLITKYRQKTGKDLPSISLCSECISFNLKELNQSHAQSATSATSVTSVPVIKSGVQRGDCFFSEVSADLHKLISDRIAQTRSDVEIIKIEQSYNASLLSKYTQRKYHMFGPTHDTIPSFTFDTQAPLGENYMFHGSKNTAYDSILDKGFDISFSKPTGLLGKGIYFARDASYSDNYADKLATDKGHIGIMLLCRVILGTKMDLGKPGIEKLPAGVHCTYLGDIYAVFDNYQAYPEFIVYYKLAVPSSTFLNTTSYSS